MSALGETLRAIAGVLDGRGLRWYVFGAQAVAVRAAPRATQDVDITVEIARKALPDLLVELEAAGLRHRYPEAAERLMKRGDVVPLRHSSGMEADIVVAGAGLEALALERATRHRLDGVTVPVAHATDLIVMKVLSGRGKDQEDARALIAAGGADIDEVRDLLAQLEDALSRSDLIPALEAAIRDVEM